MTLKEAYEIQRRELISLRRENQKLKEGTFTDAERTAMEKEIRHLKWKLAKALRDKEHYHTRFHQEQKENDRLHYFLSDRESREAALTEKIQKIYSLYEEQLIEIEDLLLLIEKLKRQIKRECWN